MIDPVPLSLELESLLLRELARTYDRENRDRFAGRLLRPVFALADGAQLGTWNAARRALSLSRAFVLDRPWTETVAVLEHEMAHQYVAEVLQVTGEPPHGPTFQRVCAERGIDARAAGPVEPAGHAEIDRGLDRIRKLLALAASANQHEAELAMRRAHELMLRHNVNEAAARAERAFEVRHLGDPTRRRSRVEDRVIGLCTEFFFVEAIRIPVYLPRVGVHGHVYEVIGTRANVDMACHVYEFLLATAERLWQQNRRDPRVRSGRDRQAYQRGVIGGFRDKLLFERLALRGSGLVWVGDASLDRFYRARYPRVVTRRQRDRISGASRAGREAGRQVVLHRPIERAGSAKPRLLRG